MPPRGNDDRPAPAPQAYATAADVERLLKGWTPQQRRCRANNHSWVTFSATENSQFHYIHVLQKCEHECGLTREFHLGSLNSGRAGDRLTSPTIDYGQSNYLAKGVGRIAGDQRSQIRIADLLGSVQIRKMPLDEAMTKRPTGKLAAELGVHYPRKAS